jgi:hypothetical protein
MVKKDKKPYSERSDIEKIKSNWAKIRGLLDRREWSSAILRAAIASEIATNLAIREELQVIRGLEPKFVNGLLMWANGIMGKFDRLLLPVTRETEKHRILRNVKSKVLKVNDVRNSVAHSGGFESKKTALTVANNFKDIIASIVRIYHIDFELSPIGE